MNYPTIRANFNSFFFKQTKNYISTNQINFFNLSRKRPNLEILTSRIYMRNQRITHGPLPVTDNIIVRNILRVNRTKSFTDITLAHPTSNPTPSFSLYSTATDSKTKKKGLLIVNCPVTLTAICFTTSPMVAAFTTIVKCFKDLTLLNFAYFKPTIAFGFLS